MVRRLSVVSLFRATVQAALIGIGILTTVAQTVEAVHNVDGGIAASTELTRGLGIEPFQSCTVASGGEFNRRADCAVDGAVGSAVSALTQAAIDGVIRGQTSDLPVQAEPSENASEFIESSQQPLAPAPPACSISSPCGPNATCTTKGQTSTCKCKDGYTGDGVTCTDVNECTTKNSCPSNSTCTNSPGSFSCACNAGYTLVKNQNQCKVSTAPSCSTNNGGCSANATCSSPSGTIVCTCKSGYIGNGVTCTDVNECATNNGGCNVNAACTNTPGGRTCACNGGYSGDGLSCTDINECATNNGGCSANAACTNTPGSRTCACNGGYSGNGVTCTDVNECATNNGGCSANGTCTNTPGSRTCACNAGYDGNGITCTVHTGNDITKPTILDISGIPAMVDSHDGAITFPVTVMATDNQSGVKKITVALKAVENVFTRFTPAMCTITLTAPYGLSFTGSCNITVATNLLGTTYSLWASVEDGSGISRPTRTPTYLFFPELAIDTIADNSLITINTAGDFVLPDLNSINGTPPVIDVRVNDYLMHLNVSATDDGSGLREVYIHFAPQSSDAPVGYCYAGVSRYPPARRDTGQSAGHAPLMRSELAHQHAGRCV